MRLPTSGARADDDCGATEAIRRHMASDADSALADVGGGGGGGGGDVLGARKMLVPLRIRQGRPSLGNSLSLSSFLSTFGFLFPLHFALTPNRKNKKHVDKHFKINRNRAC